MQLLQLIRNYSRFSASEQVPLYPRQFSDLLHQARVSDSQSSKIQLKRILLIFLRHFIKISFSIKYVFCERQKIYCLFAKFNFHKISS